MKALVQKLQEELAEQHDREHLARNSGQVKGGWSDEEVGLRKGAYSAKAAFLTESDEDTKMWGDSTSLSFTNAAPGEIGQTAPQIVHVSRKRPATFQTLVVFQLGNGWTGEGAFEAFVDYIVGVGQTRTTLTIGLPIPTPANGLQVFDARQLPVTALQIAVRLVGASVVAGAHDVQVTALVAPVTP